MKHVRWARSAFVVPATLLTTLLLATCDAHDSTLVDRASPEDLRSRYEEKLVRARQAQQEVRKLEYEWTTVPQLLARADKAIRADNVDEAVRMVEEALTHAELGIKQAHEQSKSWADAAPK